jgi:hypothetical protein
VVAGAGEQAPCFAVFFEKPSASSVRIEAEACAFARGFNRDDVPEIERDDIGGEEVDFLGCIGDFVGSAALDAVAGIFIVVGALDLHAPELAFAVVDSEVVTLAIAPGLANAKAKSGGAS